MAALSLANSNCSNELAKIFDSVSLKIEKYQNDFNQIISNSDSSRNEEQKRLGNDISKISDFLKSLKESFVSSETNLLEENQKLMIGVKSSIESLSKNVKDQESCRQEVERWKEINSLMKEESDALKSQLSARNTAILNLEGDLAHFKNRNKSLEIENKANAEKANSLSIELSSSKDVLSKSINERLEKCRSVYETKIKSQQEIFQLQAQELERTKKRQLELVANLKDLESKYHQMESSHSTSTKQVEDLEKTELKLMKTIGKLESENGELNDKINALQEQVATLKDSSSIISVKEKQNSSGDMIQDIEMSPETEGPKSGGSNLTPQKPEKTTKSKDKEEVMAYSTPVKSFLLTTLQSKEGINKEYTTKSSLNNRSLEFLGNVPPSISINKPGKSTAHMVTKTQHKGSKKQTNSLDSGKVLETIKDASILSKPNAPNEPIASLQTKKPSKILQSSKRTKKTHLIDSDDDFDPSLFDFDNILDEGPILPKKYTTKRKKGNN